MATVGSLVVNAGVSLRGFTQGLDQLRKEVKSLESDLATRGSGLASALGKGFAGGIGAGLGLGVVNSALAGARAAAGGVLSFIQGTIDAGDKLQTAINAARLQVGSSFRIIVDEAQLSAEKMGTVQSDFIATAGDIASSFKQAGAAGDEAARIGVELTRLGMNLASLKGASPEEVFTGLQASLRGEFDPLERFGIMLNAAKVENAALALGLAKTKSEITDLDKRYATLALLRQGGAPFASAAEQLRGGFGNALAELRGRIENVRASLGSVASILGGALFSGINASVGGFLNTITRSREAMVEWARSAVGEGGVVNRFFTGLVELVGKLLAGIASAVRGVIHFAGEFASIADSARQVGAFFSNIGNLWGDSGVETWDPTKPGASEALKVAKDIDGLAGSLSDYAASFSRGMTTAAKDAEALRTDMNGALEVAARQQQQLRAGQVLGATMAIAQALPISGAELVKKLTPLKAAPSSGAGEAALRGTMADNAVRARSLRETRGPELQTAKNTGETAKKVELLIRKTSDLYRSLQDRGQLAVAKF
jgi:hypothetical protein